jgi:hypothetical protein
MRQVDLVEFVCEFLVIYEYGLLLVIPKLIRNLQGPAKGVPKTLDLGL